MTTLQTNLLKGEKVYLDVIKKSDLADYRTWANDLEAARLSDDELFTPMTLEQQEEWYKTAYTGDTNIPFAIRIVEDNSFIGTIAVGSVNWQARTCKTGIVIGQKDYWGKGYGTDAMRIMLRYVFMEMNMYRMALEVISNNVRAIKSYEKVGFVQEGTLREAVWRDGYFIDLICMSILRNEWEKTIA